MVRFSGRADWCIVAYCNCRPSVYRSNLFKAFIYTDEHSENILNFSCLVYLSVEMTVSLSIALCFWISWRPAKVGLTLVDIKVSITFHNYNGSYFYWTETNIVIWSVNTCVFGLPPGVVEKRVPPGVCPKDSGVCVQFSEGTTRLGIGQLETMLPLEYMFDIWWKLNNSVVPVVNECCRFYE